MTMVSTFQQFCVKMFLLKNPLECFFFQLNVLPVSKVKNGGHLLSGDGLHLLVDGLEVHALGLPEPDLCHRTRKVLALRQLDGRILAQDLPTVFVKFSGMWENMLTLW